MLYEIENDQWVAAYRFEKENEELWAKLEEVRRLAKIYFACDPLSSMVIKIIDEVKDE